MIKLKLKEGVRLTDFCPQMVLATMVAMAVYEECGATEFVITSANDGKHMVGSFHYGGKAADWRIWVLAHSMRQKARDKIAHRLGKDFDVILESDHIHCEYDPKVV